MHVFFVNFSFVMDSGFYCNKKKTAQSHDDKKKRPNGHVMDLPSSSSSTFTPLFCVALYPYLTIQGLSVLPYHLKYSRQT
jgi:hypothetical protein